MFLIDTLFPAHGDQETDTEFDRVVQKANVRPSLKHQMLNIAKRYGINKSHLSGLGWQLPWMIENCDGCLMKNHCSLDRAGHPNEAPGIDKKDCPNDRILENLAVDLGNRSHLRH